MLRMLGKQQNLIPEILKYLGANLGITKKDLAQLSMRLVAQLDALCPDANAKAGSKPSKSDKSRASDSHAKEPTEPKAARAKGPKADKGAGGKRVSSGAPKAPKEKKTRTK